MDSINPTDVFPEQPILLKAVFVIWRPKFDVSYTQSTKKKAQRDPND
jgi:hypothetical protein